METMETKDIEELEQEGYRIIDVVAGDTAPTEELQYIIDKIVKEKRNTFYSDILYNLTSERFKESEAKELWHEILRHKYVVSEKLKRNVGVRVSALDYLENIKKIIVAPKIIDETEFYKTLKFAETDSLTGVFNRRSFIRKLSEEIGLAKHSDSNSIFSVMMLDLDGFKKFNDTEGHPAGDLILQEFTALLLSEFRKNDIISRYGGDEFIVLLPEADKTNAKKIAEKIRVRVQSEFSQINITVSIGISEFPVDAIHQDELITYADESLYRAKEFGGNKSIYFKSVEIKYKVGDEKVKEMSCVGDFNRWNKKYGVMDYNPETNEWIIKLNLKPGKYRYKFLVDGTKWIADPKQPETTDDGFGGKCSLLKVSIE